jgi:hypothetical protein
MAFHARERSVASTLLLAWLLCLAAPAAARGRKDDPSVRNYSRLVSRGTHLNPDGAHQLLPGTGRVHLQVARDARRHLVVQPVAEGAGAAQLDADVRRVLSAVGIRTPRASDPALPHATSGSGLEVIVPVMVPTQSGRERARNNLWDVDRALDQYLGLRFVRGVSSARAASWMHARTGVWHEPRKGRAVLIKGDGLSHAMDYKVYRPRSALTAIGGKLEERKPGRDYRSSVSQIKGLLSMTWHTVLGATDAKSTTAEVQQSIALHNAFADAVGGAAFADPAKAGAARQLREVVRMHGVASEDLFPTPRAVVDMSHYPVVADGHLAWVAQRDVAPSGVRRKLQSSIMKADGQLQLYIYEASCVSRLLQTDAINSLRRVSRGKASDDERAYWKRDLGRFGLDARRDGFYFRGQKVTAQSAPAARQAVRQRLEAQLLAIDLTLKVAGVSASFALKDLGLGAVFDITPFHAPRANSILGKLVGSHGAGLSSSSRAAALRRIDQWLGQIG